MAVQISRAFKDISLTFARHPVTNDIVVLKNEDAIKKSVVNLCRTRFNERFFNDLLGTRIEDALFDLNNDDEIATILELEIKTLLENYEPRIKLTHVDAKGADSVEMFSARNLYGQAISHELYIRIEYIIVGLPFPPQNIEFLLQPTRV